MAQFQTQLRWLLFITIPFVILLIVHFIIPFQIALNSFPKIQSRYNVREIQVKQRGFLSYTTTNKYILQNIMQKYTKFAQTILTVVENSQQLYSTHISNKTCITANLTSQRQITYLYNDLENEQSIRCVKIQTNSFLKNADVLDGYCRSLIQSQQTKTVLSFRVLIDDGSQLMAYEYNEESPQDFIPDDTYIISKYEPLYTLIESLNTNNQEHAVEMFITSRSNQNDSLLALCSASSRNKKAGMGVCVDINLTLIQGEIQQNIAMQQMNYVNSHLMLIISQSQRKTNETSPKIIFSTLQSDNPQGNFLKLEANNPQFMQNPNLITIQYLKKYQTIYITPISINQSQSQRIPLYLMTKYTIRNLPETVMTNLNSNLKTLAILISIASVIFSGITAYVIKTLLFSIDQECAKLENSCKFILDDDTEIEIPEYFGTKDIKEVYEKVRIINKIHRFSNYNYFKGHPAQKILRYTQALHCLKFLNYDVGNIYQNLGEAYLQLDQWQKSIQFFQLSIDTVEKQIRIEFGDMDDLVYLKEIKQVPYGFKEIELVLRRRAFKLIHLYFRYFQFSQVRVGNGQILIANLHQQEQKMRNDSIRYLSLLKKSFFPQFSSYSQSIIALIYECKLASYLKQQVYCRTLMRKIQGYIQQYTLYYDIIGKKLKEKGSKYKFLHLKNRMTSYSRMHPEVLVQLWGIFKAKIMMSSITNPNQLNHIVDLYFEGAKSKFYNLNLGFVSTIDLSNILYDLNLKESLNKFESTHIFKQSIPFRAFQDKKQSGDEIKLMKPTTKNSKGLQRQFIYLIDCLKNPSRESHQKTVKYFHQHSQNIFQKLIKPQDRVSIVKFNSNQGFKIECKLLLKQLNQSILKKEVTQSFDQIGANKTSLMQFEDALNITINRIKKLQSQKIILFYLKNIKSYQNGMKNKRLIKKISKVLQTSKEIIEQQMKMEYLGDIIVNSMRMQGLRNCKLMLICSKKDKLQECRQYFGLKDINKRIWNNTSGINENDNTVYIIDNNNKADIETLLMAKYEVLQDNNIFIL